MGKDVLILGGGVGGMSAAQELAERGYRVTVLEKLDLAGGKARSVPVHDAGAGTGGEVSYKPRPGARPWVPGEHGFRFFPGFYKHVIDTMSRIPHSAGGTVEDHLVDTTRIGISQYEHPTFRLPARFPRVPSDAPDLLSMLIAGFTPITGLTPEDYALFVSRLWQLLTTCAERRLAEYELLPWWDFVAAEGRSPQYQKMLAAGITRSLVAAKARKASTRTIGDIFIQLLLTILDPTQPTTDRVLDGPTNVAWIEPWSQLLERLGVTYVHRAKVVAIHCEAGRIVGVDVERDGRTEHVTADHYVSALPVERFAPLVTPQMIRADPRLSKLGALAKNVEWMNGLQFYLKRPPSGPHGHMIHIDTPWAITTISQLEFWHPLMIQQYADPAIGGILSVDVSDWFREDEQGRIAAECSRREVAMETWAQLKRSLNHEEEVLRDEDMLGWYLDPDIQPDPARGGRLSNTEPLLVNLVDTWKLRPTARTYIDNLYLASDYVRTHTDLATMEAANEAARRAVNGILDATGDDSERCEIFPIEEPAVLAPLKAYDRARFDMGLSWDASLAQLAINGVKSADPALAPIMDLMAHVPPATVRRVIDVEDAITPLDAAAPVEPVLEAMHPLEELVSVTNRSFGTDIDEGEAGDDDYDKEPGPQAFADRLAFYRHQTVERILMAIPGGEPVAHLYGPIREYVTRGGKGTRPGLLLATSGAHGGAMPDGLPSAAGIELLHDAFLVHDDIEDESDTRRGLPTLHRQLGVPLALNIGDAMNALSLRLFRSNAQTLGPERALRILDEVDFMLVESLEGQAMELGWIRDGALDVDTDDYLRLVLKKTAWYSFIQPMRIGALVAGQDEDLDRFDRFGYLLGAAFQVQDDVLNLVGSEGRYGKEIGGDLTEGKRTLVVSHALAHAKGRDKQRLESFFSRRRGPRLPREVADVRDILGSTGSIEHASEAGRALAAAASTEMSSAFAGATPGPDLDLVRGLVDYVVSRDA